MSYTMNRVKLLIYLLFGICVFLPLLFLLVIIFVIKQTFIYITDWLNSLVDWYEKGMKRRLSKLD